MFTAIGLVFGLAGLIWCIILIPASSGFIPLVGSLIVMPVGFYLDSRLCNKMKILTHKSFDPIPKSIFEKDYTIALAGLDKEFPGMEEYGIKRRRGRLYVQGRTGSERK